MPITPLARLVSDKQTVVALDRATAIAQARGIQVLNDSTEVGRIVQQYPQLLPYQNDNSSLSTVAPSYIWDSITTTPQIRFFALGTTGFVLAAGNQLLVDLKVFCDNAHDVQIDIFDVTVGDLFTTITPAGNLTDGNLDPNTGVTDDIPYNWLNILYYTNTSIAVPDSRDGDTFQAVLSFQAVNYNISPPGTPNPAALAFVADIWMAS
ncbi:hypothetical protein NZD89_28895 (plasmid) [Alicyclobacillus fastidiosus]|uniref:Uncharacterized protein n=1 Tax=Alicyclobacillus fastidiosus TaxID=392011 RepID=A0ABY6ZQ82_9BACL|nr:hypothetical protein [Alicyclobacillus fastidiosus]WAH45002.1 hypothetical protein NZD89_28895 [Alicyclobacillus fastidiosus]GMA66299.1 hypothetical protein GCM10025859_67410 [Alicyclobacillus fastidiosus]